MDASLAATTMCGVSSSSTLPPAVRVASRSGNLSCRSGGDMDDIGAPSNAPAVVANDDPHVNVGGRVGGCPGVVGVRRAEVALGAAAPVMVERAVVREPRDADGLSPIDELVRRQFQALV